jgi:UDP:flavonoid glycosyltransferase YjiC (YdhE family)
MRVVITTQPADGHLNPMLGLCAALRAAGHEVLLATSASFVPRIEARGEKAVAVGRDWLESGGPSEPPDPGVDPGGVKDMFERSFLRGVASEMADDLVRLIGDVRPDVLVRESVEFAGSAAAERCGVPFATFDWSFPVDLDTMLTQFDLASDAPLGRLRAHLGLPPGREHDWFLGDLTITTLPERYRGDTPVRDRHVSIRPHVVDLVDDAPVPEWVEHLRGAVYVTLGTVFPRHFPEVLSVAAAGAALARRPTVVTYGASVDRDAIDLPDTEDVHVCAYVPQGPLLDRCVVAVIHGGTGTTLGALARGVPLVVIPMGADQYAHADAVERLGAGVVLDHRALTHTAVSDAVIAVGGDPAFRSAARGVARDLAAMPGPDHAVAALARLATGR